MSRVQNLDPFKHPEEVQRLVRLAAAVAKAADGDGLADMRIIQEMIAVSVPRNIAVVVFYSAFQRCAPAICVYCSHEFRPKTKAAMLRLYCDRCGYKGKVRAMAFPVSQEAAKRISARATANMAVKRGKIVRQPCVACGDDRAEKHHPDYSKPLEVIWLCRSCHMEHHRKDSARVA